jgi:hypothetical protein
VRREIDALSYQSPDRQTSRTSAREALEGHLLSASELLRLASSPGLNPSRG